MKSRLVLAALFALAALGACSRDPGDPEYDNPFDPDGTTPGQGYALFVEARGDSVIMTWDNIPGVDGYRLYWSDESSAFKGMEDISDILDTLIRPGTAPRIEFSHRIFTAERTNYYRVMGITSFSSGGEAIPENMVPSAAATLDISALALPVGAISSTPTRFIELDLLTGVADSMEVSNRRDFSGSTVFAVGTATKTRVDWALPEVAKDRTDLWVHFRSRMAGSVGTADSFAIQARFDPTLIVERGLRLDAAQRALVLVDTTLVFRIGPLAGQQLERVIRERFVPGGSGSGSYEFVEEIAGASLVGPFQVTWDPQVEPLVKGQVKAFLRSDFGFVDSTLVGLGIPTALGNPSMEIVDGEFTTTRDIRVRVTAPSAGYVLLSEQPDFSTGSWVTYADTLDHQLEDRLGFRFLYAAVSNPILTSTAVTSTPVTLVSPPASAGR